VKVTDLFAVVRGHDLDLTHLDQVATGTGIAYVSCSGGNNGVTGWVSRIDDVEPGAAGTLTVALVGMTLSTFVQPYPYYTAQNVDILTPLNPEMTFVEKIWWATCIHANQFRFNYGRKANRTFRSLELPDEVPDWVASVPSATFSEMVKSITDVEQSVAGKAAASPSSRRTRRRA